MLITEVTIKIITNYNNSSDHDININKNDNNYDDNVITTKKNNNKDANDKQHQRQSNQQ